MSISVKCGCGKVFKVKDEMAGRDIMCQVCHAVIRVSADTMSGPISEGVGRSLPRRIPPIRAAAVAAPEPAKMMDCPACAEPIPVSSEKCPHCSELLKKLVGPVEKKERLARLLADLETYAANPVNQEADEKLRGGPLTARTIVLATVVALTVAMMAIGASMRDGDALIGVGICLAVIFGIPLLVSFVHDYRCDHIREADSPIRAYRRYFTALKTGRTKKAFASLCPQARRIGAVEPVYFENIPGSEDPPRTIDDLGSFEKYWRNVLKSPKGQVRAVRLKHPREVQKNPDGVVLVEGDLFFTSFSSWWYLTILINVIVCLIIISAVQKKETKTLSKLLVNRGGKWYFAEAEFEGVLDDTRAMP